MDEITSGRLTIGTTAVQIDGNSINPFRLYVHNEDSTKTLFMGGADVTTSNGFGIDKAQIIDFLVFPNQSVYIVSESTGHIVSWLRIPV